jgi:phospholipid/cholesterol/gamma-HCH transport system ATP-binding protein
MDQRAVPAFPRKQQTRDELMPGEPIISFHNVRLGFEGNDVLQGVSFEVLPGETKALLGESGSGKTLILKLAAGLLRPDSGSVRVMGFDLGEMTEKDLLDFRRRIGFVFQEGALFDSMSVADNVAFRLHEEKVAEDEVRRKVRESLRFVEMEDAINKFPAELSGGMRRRVSIARALVDRPPLEIYDSPTAGLDPITSQTIILLILRLRDQVDTTALLATHRIQDVFGLANYRFDPNLNRAVRISQNGGRPRVHPTNVIILREGRIYFEGDTETLLGSTDPYIKEFLHSAQS